MLIYKIRPVKTPHKGTPESAGFDFFVPDEWPDQIKSSHVVDFDDRVKLLPGQSILIPSGIKMIIPKGYVLVFFNKSGIATKEGLIVGASVVDSDYRGEVHLHVTNVSKSMSVIRPGQKLVQGLLLPVPDIGVTELNFHEWEETFRETARGEGGFGSTGLY